MCEHWGVPKGTSQAAPADRKEELFHVIVRSQRILLVFLTSLTAFFRCSGKNLYKLLSSLELTVRCQWSEPSAPAS